MTKKRDPIALLKKYPNRKFSTTELIKALLNEYQLKEAALAFFNCTDNEESDEAKQWDNTLNEAIEAFEIVKETDLLAWEAFEYLGSLMFSYSNIEIPLIRKKITEAKVTIHHYDSIIKAIEGKYELDKWYYTIEMKEFFTNLFFELNIPIKAKSTNIKAFYKADFKKLRIDGIQTAGVRLIKKLPNVRVEMIISSKKEKELK